MRYRRGEADSATVWSVGADGNDDNGDVAYTEKQPAKDVGIVLKAR